MNSKERLYARLEGKQVDKIPNMNIAMGLVAKAAGVSYREYVLDYRKLVEGADIIGVGNAVASIVGPGIYEKYALAYDRALVEHIHSHGAMVKLHICGNITALIPLLKLVAPDILDIDWMVNFSKASEALSDTGISVCGNVDPVSVLLQGNAALVEQKVRECASIDDPTTLVAAGCEVPAQTPEENLLLMDRLLYLL